MGAYYRFAASLPGPYFYARPLDLKMVNLRIAVSTKGASCVFRYKFATVNGFYDTVAAFK